MKTFLDIDFNNYRKWPELSSPFLGIAVRNNLVLKVNNLITFARFGKGRVIVPVAKNIFFKIEDSWNQTAVKNSFDGFCINFDF